MAVIVQLIYVLFCIGLAFINYQVIKADNRVYHAVNGLCHAAFIAAAYLLCREWLLFIILPLLGGVTFDIALNLFRGLPINYSSSSTKSIIDRWERKVFADDGYAPKIIYLFLLILLNFYL